MFHRSQDKQQGFAKEQRVADAQLASLKQLGLVGPEIKGFASAWGGTDPIAAVNKQYTTRPEQSGGPTFLEKGECHQQLSICPVTHKFRARRRPWLCVVWLETAVLFFCFFFGFCSCHVLFSYPLIRPPPPLLPRPLHCRRNPTAFLTTILRFDRLESIPRTCPTSKHDFEFRHDECGPEPHPKGAHLRRERVRRLRGTIGTHPPRREDLAILLLPRLSRGMLLRIHPRVRITILPDM